jgi:hypothetical protein
MEQRKQRRKGKPFAPLLSLREILLVTCVLLEVMIGIDI